MFLATQIFSRSFPILYAIAVTVLCWGLACRGTVYGQETTERDVVISVRLGGEAYEGNPIFLVKADEKILGEGDVNWSQDTTGSGAIGYYSTKSEVQWRVVTFRERFPIGHPRKVIIVFPNDNYSAGRGDRNLLVDYVSVGNYRLQSDSAGVVYPGHGAGRWRMPWAGQLEFDFTSPLKRVNITGVWMGKLKWKEEPEVTDITMCFEQEGDRVEGSYISSDQSEWNIDGTSIDGRIEGHRFDYRWSNDLGSNVARGTGYGNIEDDSLRGEYRLGPEGEWEGKWEAERTTSSDDRPHKVSITTPHTPYKNVEEIAAGDGFRVKLEFCGTPTFNSYPVTIRNTRRGQPIRVFAKPTEKPHVFITDSSRVEKPQPY